MSVSPRDPRGLRRPRVKKSPPVKTARVREGLRAHRSRAASGASQPSRTTSARSLPPLLEILVLLQRGSSVVAFSLIGAALALYAATVYLQQQWSEAYQTLERLQRETRSLTAADETFKHQLAKQAQNKETGLVFPSPSQTIYLYPASVQSQQKPTPEEQKQETPANNNAPLGY
ncbi:hypothetical protein [Oscillatoria sp. FACHB-1406]|uniref:hypothetical protein n=1 Tax=Oscillatoria sp. FACHB-1406 TaxID=2692846 RepID=UPI0016877F34|nr:hypothetical protein [Oscillatoria sp. FACHB-1406]MBD2577970.1 hypothetical protein [Oscillatoria sp. FACHB-1406]